MAVVVLVMSSAGEHLPVHSACTGDNILVGEQRERDYTTNYTPKVAAGLSTGERANTETQRHTLESDKSQSVSEASSSSSSPRPLLSMEVAGCCSRMMSLSASTQKRELDLSKTVQDTLCPCG